MARDRFPLVVFGRLIGTASGWDEGDDLDRMYYEFEPVAASTGLPSGDVCIRYDRGVIETYNDDGDVTLSVELLPVLNRLMPHVGDLD